MASLLERMNISPAGESGGPVRTKGNRSGGSSPYNRNSRPPKGDINGTWEHDMYKDPASNDRSLSSRLTSTQVVPKMNLSMADRALREAIGEKGLSIKGASARGNVVQVGGLAAGTTAADVEAIFKRCGTITRSEVMQNSDLVIVRLTYKQEKDAQAAVAKFHGQPADGKLLEVRIVGGVNASLGGRLGVSSQDNSVDVLMGDDSLKSGSKLRSDVILAQDSRASVMVAPPGANPAEYTQQPTRGGRGRGRGRGGRGRGGGARMEVD